MATVKPVSQSTENMETIIHTHARTHIVMLPNGALLTWKIRTLMICVMLLYSMIQLENLNALLMVGLSL